MLPFCDRTVSVARKDVAPVWSRSFPVSKEPKTIGEHLRKRRFDLGIRQSQAARQLRVSQRTLCLWEKDKVYPTWGFQPRLALYLGCNPFINPALGGPKGNESSRVAILAQTGPLTIGQRIKKRRVEMRKNRNGCAKELRVSVKSLWGWETGRWEPCDAHLKRVIAFLGIDQNQKSPAVNHE